MLSQLLISLLLHLSSVLSTTLDLKPPDRDFAKQPLRWGIQMTDGAIAGIGNDFINSVMLLSPEEHEIVAFSVTNIERGFMFWKYHNYSLRYYTRHEELTMDNNVDAIYIGLYNNDHYKNTKFALEIGKPVLCEKPFTMNEAETLDLIQTARRNKVFLSEAVWSRATPAYKFLREILDSGLIGEPRFVSARIEFKSTADRVLLPEYGGGSILDVGSYAIQFLHFVFGTDKPVSIETSSELNKNNVDLWAQVGVYYDDGRSAILFSNVVVTGTHSATIEGTKGTIIVPEFNSPNRLVVYMHDDLVSRVLIFPKPAGKGKLFNYPNVEDLMWEAIEVRKALIDGNIEQPNIISLNGSLEVAHWRDLIRLKSGVHYAGDQISIPDI